MTKPARIVTFVATLFLSSAAIAATGDFAQIDVNGDGKITLEEGMKLHPDWTPAAFKALDANGDGALDKKEYQTASITAPAVTDPAASTTSTTKATQTATATATEKSNIVRKTGPANYLDAAGPNDILASKLIGMRVYAVDADVDDTQTYPADSRKNWSDVGEVNDVVLDWDGSIKAVVLGVGGFLGLGEKDVAIEMASLRKVRESNDSNDWFLVVNSTKDTLTSAPSYVRNAKS